MNRAIETGIGLIFLVAISCKKENNTIQTSRGAEESSTSELIPDNEPGTGSAITIGKQVWMSRNLTVNHYRNGDHIPQVKDPTKWAALTTGAWCWYNNDSAMGAVYGKLYNWYAVNDPRGLAPAGWHVPGNAEWDTLWVTLGYNPGGKLKKTGTVEAGTGLWYAPNTGATNETGFTALPGGYHSINGTFYVIGYDGYWWSSTEVDAVNAWYRYLSYISRKLRDSYSDKANGLSVRCIKD